MAVLRFLLLVGLSSLLLAGCAVPQNSKPALLKTGTLEQPLELSGFLTENLRLAGVIRLTGDLLIPAGRTLSIEAGSTVLVVGNDSTKIDPEFLDKGTEILVKGGLLVAGEFSAPVRFILDAETPAGENWTGIELSSAEEAVFRFVDIFSAETGILSIDSSPKLEQVNILGARVGLLLQGKGELSFQGGHLSGGDAGLLCFDQVTLVLDRLQIADNQEEGFYLSPGCVAKSQDVTVERNDLGLVALPASREKLNLILRSNRVDFKPLSGGVDR